jgi:PAS domain S-box-containing protein
MNFEPTAPDSPATMQRGSTGLVSRVLLDAADVPVASLDPDGIVTSLNAAFARLCGRATGELVGTHLMDLCPAEDQTAVLAALVRVVGGHAELDAVEFRLSSLAGTGRRLRITVASEHDAHGRVVAITAIGRDLTADRRNGTDRGAPATSGTPFGGSGSRDLIDRLHGAVEVARRTGRPFALIRLDVVGLDALEETHGPARTRMALATLLERMRQQLRTHDAAMPIHHGSFAVVATDLGDIQDAAGVCYRLLSTTMEPMQIQGTQVAMTLAAGIAVDHGRSQPHDVVTCAETQLSVALADGGGFRVDELQVVSGS